MDKKLLKLIKDIEVCKSTIKKWNSKLSNVIESLQKHCQHTNTVVDETSTRGKDGDNGYGRWYKLPFYRCTTCNLIEQSYSCNLRKILEKQKCK